FLPGAGVKKVQIDRNPKHIGRRTAVDLGLVGDIKATVTALLVKVREKTDSRFLEKHVAETRSFDELLQHYVEKGPGIKPIRPEFLAATTGRSVCVHPHDRSCCRPSAARSSADHIRPLWPRVASADHRATLHWSLPRRLPISCHAVPR